LSDAQELVEDAFCGHVEGWKPIELKKYVDHCEKEMLQYACRDDQLSTPLEEIAGQTVRSKLKAIIPIEHEVQDVQHEAAIEEEIFDDVLGDDDVDEDVEEVFL